MSTPDHIASESPERNSALDPEPDVAGAPVMRAQALPGIREFGLAGLWVSWLGHRALAQPAEGM